MKLSAVHTLILVLGVLSSPAMVEAAENTVPLGGTVFIGEQGLDISATGATSGAQIAWYGPGGNPSNVPSATMSVDDPADFYISAVQFSGRTGPWFTLPANSLAFYVQDPMIELRVTDETRDFQITKDVTWIPKGDVVGFRIDTNVYEIAKRPGATGAPITIRIRGPGGVEYSSVDGYMLEDIMVTSSPFQTGPVWFTGGYESGNYQVWAESTGNDMDDNYKQEGKTVTAPVGFALQSTNPLITPERTPTTRVPITPTTPQPTATTSLPTTPGTPSPSITITVTQTTAPQTTTLVPTTSPIPGFGTLLTLVGLAGTVILVTRRR